jgi:hypothetical protein
MVTMSFKDIILPEKKNQNESCTIEKQVLDGVQNNNIGTVAKYQKQSIDQEYENDQNKVHIATKYILFSTSGP